MLCRKLLTAEVKVKLELLSRSSGTTQAAEQGDRDTRDCALARGESRTILALLTFHLGSFVHCFVPLSVHL